MLRETYLNKLHLLVWTPVPSTC